MLTAVPTSTGLSPDQKSGAFFALRTISSRLSSRASSRVTPSVSPSVTFVTRADSAAVAPSSSGSSRRRYRVSGSTFASHFW